MADPLAVFRNSVRLREKQADALSALIINSLLQVALPCLTGTSGGWRLWMQILPKKDQPGALSWQNGLTLSAELNGH